MNTLRSLIFTAWLGIGDSDVFDWGGLVSAVIGVILILPFVGIVARIAGVKKRLDKSE